MTNSEKPPFESENKVGYVSFCFETRLPNYLVGLKKKKKKSFQMQNLILEINCFPRMTTHHTAGCSYYNREAEAAGWAGPAATPPSVSVWMCTLTEHSQAHLPAISVGLSSSHHSGCVQWFPGTKTQALEDNKEPYTFKQVFNKIFQGSPSVYHFLSQVYYSLLSVHNDIPLDDSRMYLFSFAPAGSTFSISNNRLGWRPLIQ